MERKNDINKRRHVNQGFRGRRHVLHKTHIYFPLKSGKITKKSNLVHKI
jgi:hypothetical protein